MLSDGGILRYQSMSVFIIHSGKVLKKMKKMLLMGSEGVGKTSMHSVIFANMPVQKNYLSKIGYTVEKKQYKHNFMGNLAFSLWDCGGQDTFMENYFDANRETMFDNVGILIYVFDGNVSPNDQIYQKRMKYWKLAIESVEKFNKNGAVFVLLNKMDILPDKDREEVFNKRVSEIQAASQEVCKEVRVKQFFSTSIWDESLYKAWSRIVQEMIPNKALIQDTLRELCICSMAQEACLFQKSTFLTLGSFNTDLGREKSKDELKYQKISNIIKQFKLTCTKYAKSIQDMCIENDKFNILITEFNSTENILVVYRDKKIRPCLKQNIAVSGKFFELENEKPKK